MARLARSADRLKARYDVVIIGSGYGGSVSASRLARAGLKVAVLERGREVLTGEFPARFPDLKSEMQVTSRSFRMGARDGLFDVRLGDDMHVLVGCGLGGGSLINAGVALVPDARVFADEVWPGQVRQDGLLAEGYARAEAWLAPARDPDAASHVKLSALKQAGRVLGHEPVHSRVVVSFADRVNAAGIAQPACTRCGDCVSGCNVGAKNTLALTYLPDAVRHGAELFTGVRASHVARAGDDGWIVHLDPGEGRERSGLTPAVEAATVIIAAGTLGSSELLLRSRDHGLALSDRLGHRFSANGDIIAFGYGARIPVRSVGVGHPIKEGLAPVGASVSGQIEIRDPDRLELSLNIQEGVTPSPLAPLLPALFVPNGRLIGALQSLIKGVYNGPFQSLQTFFAVSHDSAGGRLRLDNGRLDIAWPGAGDEPVYARLDKMIGDLVREVGGDYVKNPLAGTVMGRQPATAHPLGGAVMGHDRSAGVVDHKCRVFDASARAGSTGVHEGLYVIDGAVIPRSLGVNPLLTISALAERAMMHLAADRGLSFDIAPRPRSRAIAVSEPGAAVA
jgi:cholesterol oxidase